MNLTHDSAGVYTCEISTETPHFKTVGNHSQLTIVGEFSIGVIYFGCLKKDLFGHFDAIFRYIRTIRTVCDLDKM